jgi:hypothetical protein
LLYRLDRDRCHKNGLPDLTPWTDLTPWMKCFIFLFGTNASKPLAGPDRVENRLPDLTAWMTPWMTPRTTYDFPVDVGPSERLPDESYEAFNKRTKRDALTHAGKHAEIAASFIKAFADTEFDLIYTEREWRSISPFHFRFADMSIVVLPRSDSYFERFVAEAESIGLPKTVSIVAWEDLVEQLLNT